MILLQFVLQSSELQASKHINLRGWKQNGSKCYWTNKQIKLVCIHPSDYSKCRKNGLWL